jgi:hypothetical protein
LSKGLQPDASASIGPSGQTYQASGYLSIELWKL